MNATAQANAGANANANANLDANANANANADAHAGESCQVKISTRKSPSESFNAKGRCRKLSSQRS